MQHPLTMLHLFYCSCCIKPTTQPYLFPIATYSATFATSSSPQKSKPKISRLAAGPGKLCRLLNIDLSLNGSPLKVGQPIWLEQRSPQFQANLQIVQMLSLLRVDITYLSNKIKSNSCIHALRLRSVNFTPVENRILS